VAQAEGIQAALHAPALPQDPAIEAAYAVIVASAVRLIANSTARSGLQAVVAEGSGQHPDAQIVTSQPGLGSVLGARVLAEFARTPTATPTSRPARTTPAPRRSPAPRAPAPWCWPATPRNRHLTDATHQWACALTASPGARAYYDAIRARGTGHHAALRQLANRLVGTLHGCLKTRTSTTKSPPGPRSLPQLDAARHGMPHPDLAVGLSGPRRVRAGRRRGSTGQDDTLPLQSGGSRYRGFRRALQSRMRWG
jgi:hypothetical protein